MSERPPLDEIRNILRAAKLAPGRPTGSPMRFALAGDYHGWRLRSGCRGNRHSGLERRQPAHASAFPATQGLCGAAVASRPAVFGGDVSADRRYLTTFGSTRSEMIVPVMAPAGVGVIGLVDVESDRLNAFTDDDRNMMERCATALLSLWDAWRTG